MILYLISLTAACAAEVSSGGPSIDLIYIESNTGGASGGHVALKIDDFVFHLQQYSDGFFRLKRESWKHFRFIYNDIENRSLYLAETPVVSAVYDRLERHFERLLLAQERNFSNLDALKRNRDFLRSLRPEHGSGPARAEIEALGLFQRWPHAASPEMEMLGKEITSRFGEEFFKARQDALQKQISGLEEGSLPDPVLSRDRTDFVPLVHTGLGRLSELLSMKAALDILESGTAVKQDSLMDAGRLPACSLERLGEFSWVLKRSVMSLLESRRPDAGRALLVQMARYQAVMRSVATGHLFVIDPFPDDCPRVKRDVFMADREAMEGLRAHLEGRLSRSVNRLCSMDAVDEAAYNSFENLAARFIELENGLEGGTDIRISDKAETPCRKGMISVPVPWAPRRAVPSDAESAEKGFRLYLGRLKRLYHYNLITSNCVTELAGEIKAALSSGDTGTGGSGPEVATGEGTTFIPFRFFDWWVSAMKTRRVSYMPSFRKRRILRMYGRENPVTVYLREFNTVTSSVYRPNPVDTSFLIFTDDAFLPRPVFGAVNTAWGLFTTAAGLVTMPFDRAARLKRGFWGVVYSLPELVFANIRKGSFSWIRD